MRKVLILLFLSFITSFGQVKTLEIWNGRVPGSIPNNFYIEKLDSLDNWIKISNVSDPTLTYYPASRNNKPTAAIVICPGGGYSRLAIDHEGSEVAKWFNNMGVSAFILKYRLPNDLIMIDKKIGPLQDAQEAIRIIRRNAKDWNIDPAKIGVIGFSAGGHLASTISTHYNDKVYDTDTISARPDFSILIYPVISMDSSTTHLGSRINLLGEHPSKETIDNFSNEKKVSSDTPPTFIVHSFDDKAVPVVNSINYAKALKSYNIPAELHIYEKGGHGYGLGRSKDSESDWPGACEKWLRQRGLLSE